ncbi:MAG TPA: VWA domain-containing protein [Vicinamibacterales bacterium]
MRFLHPDYAWWLLGGLGLAAVIGWLTRRRMGVATSSPWLFRRAHRASFLRRLPAAVFAAALLLLGVALLDPVLPYTESQVQSHGLDIVLALDLSSSMQDQMERTAGPRPSPGKTRLDATKDALKAFVNRRGDDRIGLVVFSDHAYVVSPLTFDHEYVTRYIDLVDDQMLRGEGMTAIGEGLALSNFLLARQATGDGRRNKVVVLFTDGESNAGREPLDVLAESDAAHIRVHVVGVDLQDEVKKPQVQRLLRAVRGYGGRYFSADTTRELDAASRAIDSLEKGVLVRKTYQHDTPVFQWFALPSLICFAAAFALRAIPVFIDQT